MKPLDLVHGLVVLRDHAKRPERWIKAIGSKSRKGKWTPCPCDLCKALSAEYIRVERQNQKAGPR